MVSLVLNNETYTTAILPSIPPITTPDVWRLVKQAIAVVEDKRGDLMVYESDQLVLTGIKVQTYLV